jgi:hypothetical protein
MQALLSFEQAPPMAAPFRFFITAPLFVVLAGLLLTVTGPEMLASRWTPGALAVTHLLAIGFMLQVMLGAMIQILPVVAGANMRKPLAVARIVHLLVTAGALCLAAGFLDIWTDAYLAAIGLLGSGIALFLVAAIDSLRAVPSTSATIAGFKLAMPGLLGVASLGLALAGGLAGEWTVPFVELTQLHANWGLAAWGLGLLSAVAYVVVPMFQLTPGYPAWFSRYFGWVVLAFVGLLSLALMLWGEEVAGVFQSVIVALAAAFCGMTLALQARSKRARPDATQRFWRLAMFCGLATCLLWASAHMLPVFDSLERWPLAFGVLLLAGGFMSVIVGMLYKIVPFLVWLHLQNYGQGRVIAPNMKMVLPETPMLRHYRIHLGTCLLLVAATLLPSWLALPAGLMLALSGLVLAYNLLLAAGVYRRHLRRVDQTLATNAAGISPRDER